KMTSAIVKRQELFFLNQQIDLNPMTMHDIATEIDVHESTISRMVKNKFIRTPAGTFSLRNLFTAKVYTNNFDDHTSVDYVKRKVRDIIEKENKEKPYSDQQIVNLLKDQNIRISRRT